MLINKLHEEDRKTHINLSFAFFMKSRNIRNTEIIEIIFTQNR